MDLNIYYQNINGIRSKLHDFKSNVLLSTDLHVISVTESKIQMDQLFDFELCSSLNYNLHRKDRDLIATVKQGGGGVFVLTRKDLKVTRMYELENIVSFVLWLKIHMEDGHEMLICTFYIRPCSTFTDYKQFFDHVTDIVNNLNDKSFVMLNGDANIFGIKWKHELNGIMSPTNNKGRIADSLVNFM